MPLAAVYSARVVAWRIPYQHYCIKSTTLLMHTRYITTALCIIFLFFLNTKLFSCGRGSLLALSAAGHAGGPPVHGGPGVGSGRAPWRVLHRATSPFLQRRKLQVWVCGQLLIACVDIGYVYCAVCATCGSARLCAGTPQFSFLIFFCFDCCCCTYHAVCIAPSLKLSSSLLGDGHGTTAAVAHQLLL